MEKDIIRANLYEDYFGIRSDTNWNKVYIVSHVPLKGKQVDLDLSDDSEMINWACSCIGWTRHFPRKDCKHIKKVKRTHWTFRSIPRYE